MSRFVGLLGMVMGLAVGCGGVTVREVAPKSPHALPAITVERLQACTAEFGEQLEPGQYKFHPVVEVDTDGMNQGVEMVGIPATAPDLASCMRIALGDMAPWIAERRLERRDAVGGVVVVRIGTPEIDHPYTHWRCPFMFEGLGDDTIYYGKSIDSMAALQNALIGIRQILERTGVPLRWEGFEENITGFPRDVPWDFGLAFYTKITTMIDTETEAYIRERDTQRAARRNARKKAPKKNT